MSLRDVPGLLLICGLLWMASSSHAQWCAPTCNGVLESGTQVPDPSNCLRYYVCSDPGTGTLQLSNVNECSPGYVFDRFLTTPQCVPEASIHVDIHEYCTGYCNPCLPYCTIAGQLAPDPHSVTQYYICLGEGSTLPDPVVCSSPNNYFDYKAEACGSDPSKTFGFCDNCEAYCVVEGNIPDPYDGCSYYACNPPETVSFSCASGERFNEVSLVCEPTVANLCFTKC